jgi:hypothetical protein
MKTPYDLPQAKKWFEAASKAARAAIKKVASGDENALPKARRERDKMSDLLRWFYQDDPTYYARADRDYDEVKALLTDAVDIGRAARVEERNQSLRAAREAEREALSRISPELRQYKKEVSLLTANDIFQKARSTK